MIAKSIGTKVYFADPYSSWQKGAIKNVNGLIRQYIPKNTCFSNISQQQITKIMQKINTRPREKLNFSTPRECFYKKNVINLNLLVESALPNDFTNPANSP